jgi:transcriptional regulator GlxA family with amidase domain
MAIGDDASGKGPAEIGLLLYPGAQLAAVHGLTDLFHVANRVVSAREIPKAPLIRVSHWQPDAEAGCIDRVFDTHPGLNGTPVIIVAPPSLTGPPAAQVTSRLGPLAGGAACGRSDPDVSLHGRISAC